MYKEERKMIYKDDKKILGIAAFAVFGLFMASMVSAYSVGTFEEENQELHESIHAAVENNDYELWKELMITTLTKENFNRQVEFRRGMIQKHELMEELRSAWGTGNSEQIAELRKELEEITGGNIALRMKGEEGTDRMLYGNKGMMVRSTISPEGQERRLFIRNGEELENDDKQKRIGIRSDNEEEPKRIIRNHKQKRSFWNAFRFW